MSRTKSTAAKRRRPPSPALAALRRRRAGDPESYATYRIALELPKAAIGSVISRAHPDYRIEIENRMEVPPRLLLLDVRVFGVGSAALLEEVRGFPGVVEVELREEGPESAMYRFTQRMPMVMKVIQHNRVLARYPMTIQDGWMRFETIAKPSQVRRLLQDMTRRVGPNRVEAVRRGPVHARTLGLTPPQDALFRAALRAGYFSAPRGISVSALAETLGRSKSTTSEMLSKIQRRLAETAVQLDLAPLSFAQ